MEMNLAHKKTANIQNCLYVLKRYKLSAGKQYVDTEKSNSYIHNKHLKIEIHDEVRQVMVNVAVGINTYSIEHNTFFSKNQMDIAPSNTY